MTKFQLRIRDIMNGDFSGFTDKELGLLKYLDDMRLEEEEEEVNRPISNSKKLGKANMSWKEYYKEYQRQKRQDPEYRKLLCERTRKYSARPCIYNGQNIQFKSLLRKIMRETGITYMEAKHEAEKYLV